MRPGMMKTAFALLALSACATNDALEPIELQNSYGKADGKVGVIVGLNVDHDSAAFTFSCDQRSCDIQVGISEVTPLVPSVIADLRTSPDPEVRRQAEGGLVPLLTTRLKRPDGAIYEGELSGILDPATDSFIDVDIVEQPRTGQPRGRYELLITSTLALSNAGYEVFAEWK